MDPQGQGRAVYCDFIAWVACPQPAGRGRLGAGDKEGHRAHTMLPLCLSLSWQECRALLSAPEVSSLPPGLLRGGATAGLSSQKVLTMAESLGPVRLVSCSLGSPDRPWSLASSALVFCFALFGVGDLYVAQARLDLCVAEDAFELLILLPLPYGCCFSGFC